MCGLECPEICSSIYQWTANYANYAMLKAYKDCLSPIMPKLYHNTCLCHIYNLIGETWIEYDRFKILDEVISNIKMAFTFSGSRKRRWLRHLSLNAINNSNDGSDVDPRLP